MARYRNLEPKAVNEVETIEELMAPELEVEKETIEEDLTVES